jgi:hypothetical protein
MAWRGGQDREGLRGASDDTDAEVGNGKRGGRGAVRLARAEAGRGRKVEMCGGWGHGRARRMRRKRRMVLRGDGADAGRFCARRTCAAWMRVPPGLRGPVGLGGGGVRSSGPGNKAINLVGLSS